MALVARQRVEHEAGGDPSFYDTRREPDAGEIFPGSDSSHTCRDGTLGEAEDGQENRGAHAGEKHVRGQT